jgi:N-methylhydantoinase A/oxoprolinase/acetone carboxylase beta subunit
MDVEAAARRLGIAVTTDFLEGGLHDRPSELRRRLQAAIDGAACRGGCDRVAIGYGLCGRGTVGIRARGVPLVLPRVHDCIALFLGSDAAYRREFWRIPGTFYVSAGWYEERVQPRARRQAGAKGRDADFERLAAQYGEENARAIVEFMNSWRRNYRRAAFIDTGSGQRERYASYARAMAEEFGWRYEEIPGDPALLEKLLAAEATTSEVLVVPPEHVTAFDAIEGCLKAVPVWEASPKSGKRASPGHEARAPHEGRQDGRARLGLGIDAGGTYTDAVAYDFARKRVLAKSKALTTKWDYTVGIADALAAFDAALLRKVDLVSVSTTLATNAIVEGRGQKVGLLLMPPYGLFAPSDVLHEPKALIAGRLEIDGTEIRPVVPDEVRRVAREMVERHGVGAFAVSGYAGAVNPSHELEAKAILAAETGLAVSCGHELSELLNFRTRANTAVLNARIIPLLRRFLSDVEAALRRRGIHAAVMVVKGDGSLISASAALQRPVETILSGPAASVAGARHLTRCSEAIVLDMGGTTTDTAAVRGGRVRTDPDGARVGGWKTHVRALDMRTTGLGGDSLIACEKGQLRVGPTRVAPVAWLATARAGLSAALDYLENHLDDYAGSTRPMELLTVTARADGLAPTKQEEAILKALRERPHSVAELAERTDCVHWGLLPLERLEGSYVVQRAGLTPTDLLHVLGRFRRWDTAAAHRFCGLVSRVSGLETDDFVERILDQLTRKLAVELLKKQLDEETDPDVMDECPACQAMIRSLVSPGPAGFAVSVRLGRPVIGLGAPVHHFLPQAAKLLGARVVIPRHADVANAIGAITSRVSVSKQARIEPNAAGGYAVHGLPDPRDFSRFDDAHCHAVAELERLVRRQALEAGTAERRVELRTDDRISSAADGTEIFLERVVTATLSGPPDVVPRRRA